MATDSDMRDVLKYLLEKIKEIAPHNKEFKLEFKQQPTPASAAPPTTHPKQQGSSGIDKRSSVVQLDSLRRQGNRFFKDSNYIGAMNLYSQCILQSGETLEGLDVCLSCNSEDEKRQKVAKVRRILFLAFSNRSETWLRLKDYSRALGDADRALESEPNHAKCLVRRGKSLDGLQRYEEAVFCFTAALQLFPNDVLIQNSLRSSKICHLQSQEGQFDFSNCDDGGALDPWCDFVGPVEIQRRLGVDGYGGRGVFLTKSAIAGQLLLVNNALAILGGDPSEKNPLRAIDDYWIARASGASVLPTEDDLALHLSFGASRNAELRAKLESLFMGVGGQQADRIPDMKLFKPGAKWIPMNPPPGAGQGGGLESMFNAHKESLDRMRKIVEYNAFTDFDDWGRAYSGRAGREGYLRAGCGGLWLLPSFFNHSCAPNCTKVYIGNAVFVRASRAMDAGEELSLAYCDVSLGVDSRRDRLRKWGFECRCRRCLSETSNNAAAAG